MRHHTKKTSQTRPPLKIYNKNTNNLQLPGSSEALAVYQRICTELYFTCIYSVFFPQGLLRLFLSEQVSCCPQMSIGCHLYLQVTTLQHTHLLYFSPKKRPNGHHWLVLYSPGSLLILAHWPHCRKRLGKLSPIQNIGSTQAMPSSPTHPSWAQGRSLDRSHLHLALGRELYLQGVSHAPHSPEG